jgi:hypothetical protein
VATATKINSSGDQQTLRQSLSAADVLAVHVIPSGLVMTRLPVPEPATATNINSSGDQHTLTQLLSAADVLAVHTMPSGLVMTRLPVPELATATNINSSGDQHTLTQLLSAADVLAVHVLTHLTASEDEGMQAMAWARTRSNVPGLASTAL